ncbi:PREDICTED: probetacellulin [Hipposideros armiger]|uniref:Probetacellulin n=1 Tax=Hipposideros armiger TaxID=186990 RepID=A0A8B7PV97_HIPAR|nr:PREDICTED: probetacellulin [Hipposideros armiger]
MERTAPGSGASSQPLLLAFALGLVILHCVVADGNSTRSPENDGLLCGDAGENCAATTTQSKWNDYFGLCPRKYEHYCINGRCRFVVALRTPSCLSPQPSREKNTTGTPGSLMFVPALPVNTSETLDSPLRRKKKEEMANLGKDITPVNEDAQETSIA